ncbi:MAG: polyprenyl synthetase family protein [Janthinobacterium lividum]
MSFDLADYLATRRALCDEALDAYLPETHTFPPRLHEAMRYSLFCGGKRLRPILVFAGAEAVGGKLEWVIPLACAVECIHTFSLIHDDLPAIDNDDLRRGNPTSHIVYGEAMAILAGDALLAMAFDLIAECRVHVPADRVLDAVAMVARASGTRGMVGGQVSDIESEGRSDLDEAAVASIHDRKTGALLLASLLSGARMCGATPEQERSLYIYGTRIGLAFQITDDILDLEGDEGKLGKPLGSDLKQDKATYPKILGIPASRALARRACDAALTALDGFDHHAEPLRALAHYIVERDS